MWDKKEFLSEEFKSLGFYISDHPLNNYKTIFNQLDIKTYKDVNKTNFLLVDFDGDGEFLSVKDLAVSYNIDLEYPDLNMDDVLIECG